MVNSEQFAERLQMLFDYYELSAGTFADEIEVGRPSISHILSGRNKPSLDFVMKVVKRFKEVDLYWLLNGKGSFPSTPIKSPTYAKENLRSTIPNFIDQTNKVSIQNNDTSVTKTMSESPNREVTKIILCYADGSFEIFDNSL